MKIEQIINRLRKSGISILTLRDLKKLFEINIDNTAYKTAEKLVKKEMLVRLKKGVYASTFHPPEDFQTANFLYPPSYVSFETALKFYGILSQFPYPVSSATLRKTKRISSGNKEFEYVHLRQNLFWGYEKQKGFLIALPEKALIDELYLVSKGWRQLDYPELDCSKLSLVKLKRMAGRISYPPFRKLWSKLKL
jgi:hypothetical protein